MLVRVRKNPINETYWRVRSQKTDRSVNQDNDSVSPVLDRRHSAVVTAASKFGLLIQVQIGFHIVDRDPGFISDNGALDCCRRLVVNAFGLKFHERSSLGDFGWVGWVWAAPWGILEGWLVCRCVGTGWPWRALGWFWVGS